MKFQMLAMGARFEFEGKVYVKTGPLTAMSESGAGRMIPRYAPLRPLDGTATAARETSGTLEEAAVLAAFAVFERRCAAMLATLADEARAQALAAELAAELEAARAEFLAALTHAGKRD